MPSLAQRAQSIADLYQPPPVGRPSDIGSQSTVQQFLEAVGEGNYIDTAAKLAGITKQSVYEWIKRGETGEEPFATFADSVKEAEARAEAQTLANVRAASKLPQFWAAGMTFLERRHPDRWGKRQDDQQVPRVVVQIGVGQGEVKVGLAFAPLSDTDVLSSTIEAKGLAPANSLETQAFAEPSSPITAIMVTKAEACHAPADTDRGTADSCRRIEQGTLPGGAVATPRRRQFLGKGRSRSRPRKEKGLTAVQTAREGV